MDKIHRATVKVLENTGVQFRHDEALNILEKNGALVDRKTKTAKIPEAVFDEFRDKAPNEFPRFNRSGKRVSMRKDFSIATFGDGTYFTDRDGTQRPSTLKDIEKIMIVGDALENVDEPWVGSMPTDLHPSVQMIHSFEVSINNSPTKPVPFLSGENGDQMRYAMRIGVVLLGGMEELRKTPVVSGGGWATSPLVHANEILDSQIMAAEEGFPTYCGSMATAITTAPATLAGTLVVWNAEVMSSLVLSQMIASGVPFEIRCSGSAADPRRGYYPVGNPEMALINAGCMELSNYYGLPCEIAGC
jgi:trimethylamine--corrinoid protein Co-methyltransferase